MAKKKNTPETNSDVAEVVNTEIVNENTPETNSDVAVLQPDTIEPTQKKAKVVDGRVEVQGQHAPVLVSAKTARIISKFK